MIFDHFTAQSEEQFFERKSCYGRKTGEAATVEGG